MKYLYIFANAFTALTGGDRHFIELARRWEGLDEVDLYLVIPKSAVGFCNRENLQIKSLIIPPGDIKRLGIAITYILRTLIGLFKLPKFGKDIIAYSASDCFPDILPALFSKLFNRKSKWVACSFHLVQHYSKRQGNRIRNIISYFAQRISIFILRLADLVIVDNSGLKLELRMLGINDKKIFVSSMGVDKSYIDSIKKGEVLYDGCFVGRLHPAKGIFDLINIWHSVLKKKKDARLAVIGKVDKDIIGILEQKMRELGINNSIDLLGFLEEGKMYEVIKASKIFVFPSHEEGWGIAIAEAMACGLPAVIYDLPALREVFPKGAVRIDFGNIDRFAEEIALLLSDAARYSFLKKEAFEIAGRYTWDNVACKEWERICGIYKTV